MNYATTTPLPEPRVPEFEKIISDLQRVAAEAHENNLVLIKALTKIGISIPPKADGAQSPEIVPQDVIGNLQILSAGLKEEAAFTCELISLLMRTLPQPI